MSDFQVREGIVLKDVHPDSIYGFEFFTFRSPPAQLEMDLFIKHAKGKKCFLDVGACAGIFSCMFQVLTNEVSWSFEPSLLWFDQLKHNVKGRHAFISNSGLSDHDGELEGHYEADMFITGQTELLGIDPTKHPERELIPVRKGDTFCGDLITPDIIKIDVEGHEACVLRGLMETIKRCKPVIFIEVHRNFLAKVQGQQEFDEVFALLPEHDTETISDHNKVLIFR